MSSVEPTEQRVMPDKGQIQVGEVEVFRCMCGKEACRHCKVEFSPHHIGNCPSCGNPRNPALNTMDAL